MRIVAEMNVTINATLDEIEDLHRLFDHMEIDATYAMCYPRAFDLLERMHEIKIVEQEKGHNS